METGIGSWSEDDIVKAIRNGQRPDGTCSARRCRSAGISGMSDTDAHAIAAYIKTVPAIHNEVPPSTYQFPLIGYGPPVTQRPDVPKTDPVKYGEYLAGPIGHCMDCHTTYVNGAIDMKQLGHGGNVYAKPFGYDWAAVSANITPDPDAGLGKWTDDEIKTAITTGRQPRRPQAAAVHAVRPVRERSETAISTRSSRICGRSRRSAGRRRPRRKTSRRLFASFIGP